MGGGASGVGGEASAGPRGSSGGIGWSCGRCGGRRRGLHEALLRSLSLLGGAFNEKRSKSKFSCMNSSSFSYFRMQPFDQLPIVQSRKT